MVPGGQFAGHPDPRRLRLHARLSGGAVLARQPPEHDPRRHARHPGLDLLGRKVLMEGGQGPAAAGRSASTPPSSAPSRCRPGGACQRAGQALQQVGAATKAAWATGEPAEALANAVPYMQAFGHVVLAWIWLDVALATLSTRCGRHATCKSGRTRGHALFLPLRAAQDRRLAAGGANARRHLRTTCPRTRSDGVARQESPHRSAWIWVLIYGGLLPGAGPGHIVRTDRLGWAAGGCGAVLACGAAGVCCCGCARA
jgi:hypothetical protein